MVFGRSGSRQHHTIALAFCHWLIHADIRRHLRARRRRSRVGRDPRGAGCSVSGQTIAEARARVREALSAYFEDVASVEIEEEEIGW